MRLLGVCVAIVSVLHAGGQEGRPDWQALERAIGEAQGQELRALVRQRIELGLELRERDPSVLETLVGDSVWLAGELYPAYRGGHRYWLTELDATKLDEAMGHFARAIELQPETHFREYCLQKLYEGHILRAEDRTSREEHAEAIEAFGEAYRVAHELCQEWPESAYNAYAVGMAAKGLGRHAEAVHRLAYAEAKYREQGNDGERLRAALQGLESLVYLVPFDDVRAAAKRIYAEMAPASRFEQDFGSALLRLARLRGKWADGWSLSSQLVENEGLRTSPGGLAERASFAYFARQDGGEVDVQAAAVAVVERAQHDFTTEAGCANYAYALIWALACLDGVKRDVLLKETREFAGAETNLGSWERGLLLLYCEEPEASADASLEPFLRGARRRLLTLAAEERARRIEQNLSARGFLGEVEWHWAQLYAARVAEPARLAAVLPLLRAAASGMHSLDVSWEEAWISEELRKRGVKTSLRAFLCSQRERDGWYDQVLWVRTVGSASSRIYSPAEDEELRLPEGERLLIGVRTPDGQVAVIHRVLTVPDPRPPSRPEPR